jgi:hypothetical protein
MFAAHRQSPSKLRAIFRHANIAFFGRRSDFLN